MNHRSPNMFACSTRAREFVTYFEIQRPAIEPGMPLIVHIPHSSANVPAEYRADFAIDDRELASELLAMTDHYTDELAADAAKLGGSVFVNRLSRLVMDPERFSNDEAEPMSKKGMGAIYVSRQDGSLLRNALSDEQRNRLIADLYDPYHRALEELLQYELDDFGRCVVVDLHSFPAKALPYEDASLARPHICIGYDDFHGDDVLRDRWSAQIHERGLDVTFNAPFAGSLVPSPFYRRDRRVRSLMIEVRRDLYMDEESGAKTANFGAIQSLVSSLLVSAAH